MRSNFDPSEDENFKEKEEEINMADELVGKFRSKADIYSLLTLKYQLFLAHYEETKLSWIEKIMSIAV